MGDAHASNEASFADLRRLDKSSMLDMEVILDDLEDAISTSVATIYIQETFNFILGQKVAMDWRDIVILWSVDLKQYQNFNLSPSDTHVL